MFDADPMTRLEGRIEALQKRMDAAEKRIAGLESALDVSGQYARELEQNLDAEP